MIVGIGLDVVPIEHMHRPLARYGGRPFSHFFTPAEIDQSRSNREPARFFAERFAVKEATLKALGTGWSGDVSWHDVEVTAKKRGHGLRLTGEVQRLAAEQNATECRVSFASRGDIAFAVVVFSTLRHRGESPSSF